jgi:hypothetical protein
VEAKIKILKIHVLLWRRLYSELRKRSGGRRESGAFLLGTGSRICEFICYDDIDPTALETGIVKIKGVAFVRVWEYCALRQIKVLADVHTHPSDWTEQSYSDQSHPVVSQAGHIAIILPSFASRRWPSLRGAGIYEYLGEHRWKSGKVKISLL